MQVQGIWFFVVARILYSGKWGFNGKDFMTGDIYSTAGVLFMVIGTLYGLVFLQRAPVEAPNGFAAQTKFSKYEPVATSATDA